MRTLKFVGALILHTLSALLGTAILESTIWSAFPMHSVAGVLWKELLLGAVCAGFIGFFIWRRWSSKAATLAWILPGVWFALGSMLLSGSGHSRVFSDGSLWGRLSGIACNDGSAAGCRTFFAVTVPLVRGISYSIGAYVSSVTEKVKPQPIERRLS